MSTAHKYSHVLLVSEQLCTLQYLHKMADEERKTSKRSRFDQTEPDVKRNSRFDRRSRSPSSRTSETRRSRSPLAPKTPFSPGTENKKSPLDPAAAAGKHHHNYWPGAKD